MGLVLTIAGLIAGIGLIALAAPVLLNKPQPAECRRIDKAHGLFLRPQE